MKMKDSIVEKIELAKNLYEKEDYINANHVAQEVLEMIPNNIDMLEISAAYYHELQQYKVEIPLLQTAISAYERLPIRIQKSRWST